MWYFKISITSIIWCEKYVIPAGDRVIYKERLLIYRERILIYRKKVVKIKFYIFPIQVYRPTILFMDPRGPWTLGLRSPAGCYKNWLGNGKSMFQNVERRKERKRRANDFPSRGQDMAVTSHWPAVSHTATCNVRQGGNCSVQGSSVPC